MSKGIWEIMQNYTFQKRDYSEIDRDIATFNKLPREGIIDNFNRRIDLDYIKRHQQKPNE